MVEGLLEKQELFVAQAGSHLVLLAGRMLLLVVVWLLDNASGRLVGRIRHYISMS